MFEKRIRVWEEYSRREGCEEEITEKDNDEEEWSEKILEKGLMRNSNE